MARRSRVLSSVWAADAFDRRYVMLFDNNIGRGGKREDKPENQKDERKHGMQTPDHHTLRLESPLWPYGRRRHHGVRST